MSNVTKEQELMQKVEKLHNNTPEGIIRDADTILVDLLIENDFYFSGFAEDIFRIYRASTDKDAVTQMFYEFTGMEFVNYLEKCINEITQ